MIKAIFFDSGNVLVREGYTPGIAAYEREHRIEPGKLYRAAHDFPFWREFTLGRITEHEYFAAVQYAFGKDLDIQALKQAIINNFLPNPELLDFLPRLRTKYTLGIISNNPKEWFDYCWNNFGWAGIFSVKAVSGEVHMRKPEPEIFAYALQAAGVKGEEALYVDDRADRVSGAESFGMRIAIFENFDQFRSLLKAKEIL